MTSDEQPAASRVRNKTSHSPLVTRHSSWAVWLATGLGVGYGPVMPGTYGSALGVLLYLAVARVLQSLPHAQILIAIAALVIAALSLQIVAIALRSFQSKDPQVIVLDEVAGQFVTLLPLPLASSRGASYWLAVIVGFGLFRMLDATKPYPIRKFERLPRAWGVVGDDLAAGVVGAMLLVALQWLGWKM